MTASKPHKPLRMDLHALNAVISDLQDLQDKVNSPPPESFEKIPGSITTYLKRGDTGLQGNASHVIGRRYYDAAGNFKQGWQDVKAGIGALVGLLQQTVDKHAQADRQVADAADATANASTPSTAVASASRGGTG